MKKKIFILIIIVILIVVAGGIFWWRQNREIKGSPADYVIKETTEGKVVENKKAGLTIKVPEGWEIKRVEFEEGAINFYSPNTEVELREEKIVLPIKNGCLIQTNVVYKEIDFEQIQQEARMTHIMLGVESDEFEEITINNYKALKNVFDLRKYGPSVGIYIPVKNKGYAFYLYWDSEEREKCLQEFNKFLDTVSIR
jgi:hypothetical protein